MRLPTILSVAFLLVACTEASVPVAPSQAPLAPLPPGAVRGTVVESLSASSYSYLRLSTGAGDVWAAVPNTEVATGVVATVVDPLEMLNFESKTLNRTFDRILFGTLQGDSTTPESHRTELAKAGAPAEQAPGVNPAPTSVSVADVHAQRATLQGTVVTVTGEVVKFTPRVMDRNWLHLRDGSGSDLDKTNDLTVTTTDTVSVGDRVTVTGVLGVDRDFGAGYSYSVIVEGARVGK